MARSNGGIIGRERRWPQSGIWDVKDQCFPQPKILYGSSDQDGTNLNDYSFTGMACGPAAPGRKIIVATLGRVPTSSTCSINSASATRLAGFTQGASLLEFYGLEVPVGTTVDVAISFNATAARAALAVYSLYNASLEIASGPVEIGNGSGTSLSAPLNVKRGYAVVGATVRDAFGNITWSGLTEDADVNVESGQDSFSVASLHPTTSQRVSISAVGSSGGDNALVAIAFGRP